MLSRRMNSLASTLRPFGIEITRQKRCGGIRHMAIYLGWRSRRNAFGHHRSVRVVAHRRQYHCGSVPFPAREPNESKCNFPKRISE